MKTECDYLNGRTKKSHIHKNLPKMVNPTDKAGNAEEETGDKTLDLEVIRSHKILGCVYTVCFAVVNNLMNSIKSLVY